MPAFDELCRRSLDFALYCISDECGLIKQIASVGKNYARSESPLGQNMLFCTDGYRSPLNSLLFSLSNIVNSYFREYSDVAQLRITSFLSELIEIADENDKLSNSFVLSYIELCDINFKKLISL